MGHGQKKMSRRTKGIMRKQREASTKSRLDSKQLRQTQKLAVQIRSGKLDTKHTQRRKSTTMQFKSPGSRVQSKPKGSSSQFKSPGSIIPSNTSTPAAQTKSPTLTALPV